MKRKRVAVIYGGKGRERDISAASARFLLGVIDKDRYTPIPIYIRQDGTWTMGEDGAEISLSPGLGDLTVGGRPLAVDAVFPMLHGDFGEDGTVGGALECLGIPYVGCRVTAGAVLADKILTKAISENAGIPTVPYVPYERRSGLEATVAAAESKLGYPMFVKPATLGSSIGAAEARDRGELIVAIKESLALAERGLIEKYVENRREIEVGYLGYEGGEIISEGGEIVTDGWYDYNEKYSEGTRARILTRAELSPDIRERLREYTGRLVRLFGIRQISRLDYFVVGDEIYLNEINTMPGFTEASLYPRLIADSGISESELVTLLIEGATLL